LSVGSPTVSALTLSWVDNSDSETGFKIYRSLDGTTGWTLIHTTAANVTTYQNTGLNSSTVYYYKIHGYSGNGDSAYTSNANGTTSAPPAALTYRASSSNTGSTGAGGTLSVNKPTGVVDGDEMRLACSSASIVAFTPPNGWDFVETISETGTPNNKLSVYKRTASGEGASYVFTTPAFATISLGIVAFYSSTGRSIVAAGTATTNVTTTPGTSQVAPSMVTTIDNATLMCFYTVSNSVTGTPHSGMDERVETSGASSLYIMTQNVASAGATGTRTATSAAGLTSAAITLAIAENVS
jgi:hypothetical protein